VLAVKQDAAAKLRSAPAETLERKTRQGCMLPLCTPARDIISTTCEGVYALTLEPVSLKNRRCAQCQCRGSRLTWGIREDARPSRRRASRVSWKPNDYIDLPSGKLISTTLGSVQCQIMGSLLPPGCGAPDSLVHGISWRPSLECYCTVVYAVGQ